jgi:hypothetical protein
MMGLEAGRRLEVGPSLVIGSREMRVVSEVISFYAGQSVVFAILLSPIALVIFEEGKKYALSLVDESEVTIEDLIQKDPSLREKLNRGLSPVNGDF